MYAVLTGARLRIRALLLCLLSGAFSGQVVAQDAPDPDLGLPGPFAEDLFDAWLIQFGAINLYDFDARDMVFEAGSRYSMQPRLAFLQDNAPENLPLQFQIYNPPGWIRFDESTGVFTAAPTLSDAGVYSGLKICVTLGALLSCLPEFAIGVKVPEPPTTPRPPVVPTYTTQLSWDIPARNIDGSEMIDLAGYTVYHGVSPDDLQPIASVPSSGLTSLSIRGLAAGQHYFAVGSFNTAGVHSMLSSVVGKTFQ